MTKSPWPVRIVLALAVTVYIVYSSFGIAHPCLWGHMGHHEAEYMMRVRTTFRQHMLTPATHAGYDVPPWQDYYFHHPIGYHHLLGIFTLIVGDHIWTPTLFPALTGLLTMLALFVLVRRWWSREWAAVAVATWVGLPIIWTFSILTDAMFPAMACSIYFCHCYLEFTEKPSKTWLKRTVLTQLLFGLLFWEAYFQAVFHGLQIIVWGRTKRGRAQKVGRWPAWIAWFVATAAMSSATMAFHLIFLWKKGMWADFLTSFQQRHSASFNFIYTRHKEWLHLLYGWPLVYIGFLWLGVFVVRACLGHARKRDQAVLIFFAINTIYIILFAEGSSLHLYRVFWYSSFLVLAVTDLACDLYGLLERAAPGKKSWAMAATAAVLGAYFVVETPHSFANLLESRVMMGTLGEPHYNADYPKQLFAMEVAKRTGPKDLVLVHRNLPHRVEFWYYVDRTNRLISTVAEAPRF
ncbi:MAG: ArnT family glycosyltransferase, partial [Polyangia bacterium]